MEERLDAKDDVPFRGEWVEGAAIWGMLDCAGLRSLWAADGVDQALAIGGNDAIQRIVKICEFREAFEENQKCQHAITLGTRRVGSAPASGAHARCEAFAGVGA